MFDRRNIKYTYLKLSKKIKDFLLSDKSREFLIFLFFFLIAGGFWLLQTLNNDYEAEFSIPVRMKDLPNNVVLTSEPPSELRVRVKDKGTVLLNYMLGKSFFSFLKLCLFCTIHKDKIAARKKINHLRAFFYPCFYAYKNKCFNDRAFHD